MKFRKESIKELRGDMPLRTFAIMVGTSAANINNWELGYVKPGIDSLIMLAKHFDKDLNFFVSGVHKSDTREEGLNDR